MLRVVKKSLSNGVDNVLKKGKNCFAIAAYSDCNVKGFYTLLVPPSFLDWKHKFRLQIFRAVFQGLGFPDRSSLLS